MLIDTRSDTIRVLGKDMLLCALINCYPLLRIGKAAVVWFSEDYSFLNRQQNNYACHSISMDLTCQLRTVWDSDASSKRNSGVLYGVDEYRLRFVFSILFEMVTYFEILP